MKYILSVLLLLAACKADDPPRKCVHYKERILTTPKDVPTLDLFSPDIGGGLSLRRVKVCVEWRTR